MADSFDILDQLGNDNKKVEQLKAKIEKNKNKDIAAILDDVENKIEKAAGENRSTEEIVSGIINANFEALNGEVNQTEKDLQELMLHLRAMLDSCGGEFSKLEELNPQEQAIIDNAIRTLEELQGELKDAKEMSNAWNILFGMKNRKVRRLTDETATAETGVENAKQQANKMYRDRLKNADLKDSLNRIISQVKGMIVIIEGMIQGVEVQIDALKNRKELAFETKEKAATVMKERKSELEDLEAKINASENELKEMQSNSPEYTELEKRIADMREQRAELKGKYNIALGIFQSKERFVDQIVVHLEAQTTTKNNLKQLIGQLKSDTEERVTTYESGLQLIQSATAQEAASIYEEAGTKTDQKITEIAAKVFVSSEKDRIERVKKHPQRMSELHKVLVAMAEATAKYKEEDKKIMKEHSEKFGIDISEKFVQTYENDDSGNQNSTEKKEKPKSSSNDSVNDLMD